MKRRIRRECDCECISIGKLHITMFYFSHQWTCPSIPLSLNCSCSPCTMIRNVIDNLIARTHRQETELTRLTARALNGHTFHLLIISDGKVVVATIENILHTTTRLFVCIENVNFWCVQAEDYSWGGFETTTLTGERTMHLHQQVIVRSKQIHRKLTVISPHRSTAAIRVFYSLESR